ncbi:hypothetical protein HK098_004278 [Nowakowskiella sp. JEL0407]|nr:hypothetical protein HK098_004278 [Nowakowskiella sp. JEL0407]
MQSRVVIVSLLLFILVHACAAKCYGLDSASCAEKNVRLDKRQANVTTALTLRPETSLAEESPTTIVTTTRKGTESEFYESTSTTLSPSPQSPQVSPSPVIFSPSPSPEFPIRSPVVRASPTFQIIVVDSPSPAPALPENSLVESSGASRPTQVVQINPNAIPGNLGDNQVGGGGSAGGSQPSSSISFPNNESKSDNGASGGAIGGIIGAVLGAVAILAIAGFAIYKRRASKPKIEVDEEFASISSIKSAWPKNDSQPPALAPIAPVLYGQTKFDSSSEYQKEQYVKPPLPAVHQQHGLIQTFTYCDSIMSEDPLSPNDMEASGVADAARKIAGVQSRETYMSSEYPETEADRRETSFTEITGYNERRDTFKSESEPDTQRDTFITDSDYDKNRQTTMTVFSDFTENTEPEARDTMYTEATSVSRSSSSSSSKSGKSKFSFTDSESSGDDSSEYEPNARDTLYTQFTETTESSDFDDRRMSDLVDNEVHFQPYAPPPYTAGSSVPVVPRIPQNPPLIYRKGGINSMVAHPSPLGRSVTNADDLSSESSGSLSRYSGSSKADRD